MILLVQKHPLLENDPRLILSVDWERNIQRAGMAVQVGIHPTSDVKHPAGALCVADQIESEEGQVPGLELPGQALAPRTDRLKTNTRVMMKLAPAAIGKLHSIPVEIHFSSLTAFLSRPRCRRMRRRFQ